MLCLNVLLITSVFGHSLGLFFGGSSQVWDGLRVKWDLNPFSSLAFAKMPRTEADAKSQGWSLLRANCSGSTLGKAYTKGGDHAVTLLYDVNGYIAGIQAGIPMSTKGYPTPQIMKYFTNDGAYYMVTAYFTNPAHICTSGRTKANFDKYGTGDAFYWQQGPNPLTDSVSVAMDEKNVQSEWTKGKCFYTMGMHYWYGLSKDMNCDEFKPIFLLYNKGKLNGFGWAMKADLTSDRFEHPPVSVTPMFMNPAPDCILAYKGKLSTMHVYMTDSPRSSYC